MPRAITRKQKARLRQEVTKTPSGIRPDFLSTLKVGDLVITKRSGVIGRETLPHSIREVTKTEIVIGTERFSRKTGEAIQELRIIRTDEGEKVKEKPEPYPARIVRLATPEDLKKVEAQKRESAENQKVADAKNQRLEGFANAFPTGIRPVVSEAWTNEPGALRLEFDGMSEAVVRQIAELLKQVKA